MPYVITRANPEGNLTLFVQGPAEKSQYVAIGTCLLKMPEFSAEQVGFVAEPEMGGAGRLNMMGGEFCGNAARSFGYWLAEKQGLDAGEIPIEITGCDKLLSVKIDRKEHTAYIQMPPPTEIRHISLPGLGTRPLVCFDGILHVLLEGVGADETIFSLVRQAVYSTQSPEALGVMFLDKDHKSMAPVVYVHAPDTLCFEQSCGSGSTAAAAWLAMQTAQREFTFKQPGGTLTVRVKACADVSFSYEMGGGVYLESPKTVTLHSQT